MGRSIESTATKRNSENDGQIYLAVVEIGTYCGTEMGSFKRMEGMLGGFHNRCAGTNDRAVH
jgi:hypothetical protein